MFVSRLQAFIVILVLQLLAAVAACGRLNKRASGVWYRTGAIC